MIVAVVGVAWAQEEPCRGVLTAAEVGEGVQAAQDALRTLDGDRASYLLTEVDEFTRCLGEVLPPQLVGTYAALSSVVAFYEQDFEEARRYANLAVATTGMSTAGVVEGPPRWWADYGAVTPEVATAAGVAEAPSGGLVVLDGRALTALSAATDAPHLLQLVDRKGRVVSSRWIDGSAFPEDIVGDGGTPRVPSWWVEPPPLVVVDAPPPPDPAAPAPAEVVFDGVIQANDDCPWTPDPQDVAAKKKKVTVAGTEYALRTDEELVAFHQLLNRCGELRAARRFARWSVASGKTKRELSVAWVEALITPEPKKKKGANKKKPTP